MYLDSFLVTKLPTLNLEAQEGMETSEETLFQALAHAYTEARQAFAQHTGMSQARLLEGISPEEQEITRRVLAQLRTTIRFFEQEGDV